MRSSLFLWPFINRLLFSDHCGISTTASGHNRHSTGSESQNLSILSPFDEQEEWHKISEILNSFGTNLGANVKESTTPNNCKHSVNFLAVYDVKWRYFEWELHT